MRTAIKELIEAVDSVPELRVRAGTSRCRTPGRTQLPRSRRAPSRPERLNLQRELTERGIHIPIIFNYGHCDIPMSVSHEGGAVEFLTKPFREQTARRD